VKVIIMPPKKGAEGEDKKPAPPLATQDRSGEGLAMAIASPAATRLTLVKPSRSASVLRAEGLKKRYRKRTVVSDVSLTVESGEVVGLLGPTARARPRAST
jgi:ABC-type glutathione transport system ATPase component